MEDTELRERLEKLEKNMEMTLKAAEKSRKYLVMMMVGSAAAFLIPLIGIGFIIPSFIGTYSSLGGL